MHQIGVPIEFKPKNYTIQDLKKVKKFMKITAFFQ